MSKSAGCIWLVDDDEEDLMLMQAAFNIVAPKVEIHTLLDGADLLPELQAAQAYPNLILLDLNMNHVGGIEALKRLRAVSQYQHLAVAVLTTSTNPMDREKSAAVGASDYYSKPSTFPDLTQLALLLTNEWLPGAIT